MFARLHRASTDSWLYVHTPRSWGIEDPGFVEDIEREYQGFELEAVCDTPTADEDMLLFYDESRPGAVYFGSVWDMVDSADSGGRPRVLADHHAINAYPVPGELVPVMVADGSTQFVETWPVKVAPLRWK